MDQDKTIKKEVPNYLSKYRDPDARKKYLNEKNKEQYHKKKNLNKIKEDKTMNNAEISIKPNQAPAPSPAKQTEDPFAQALNMLKEEIKDEDDPIFKAINKYGKYIPLALEFFKGFTQNMQAYNAQQQQQNSAQPQQRGPQPPEGWLYLTPIQRLEKKYLRDGNINPWYEQGEAFEKGASYNNIRAAVASNRPVAMERTIHGQQQAAYQNMEELRRIAENERWDSQEKLNKTPNGSINEEKPMDLSQAKEVSRKDGQPSSINEAIGKNALEDPQAQTEVKASEVLQELGGKLMEDCNKYLQMIIDFVKNTPTADLKAKLKDPAALNSQLKMVTVFLPFQAKEAFKRLPFDELEAKIKEQSPEKVEELKKAKLRSKIKKLWEDLQTAL